MRYSLICFLLLIAGLAGCGGGFQSVAPPTPPIPEPDVYHQYNGTASQGDFLTITVDVTKLTITYKNISNGMSGTVPYTVNADGSYAISDPTGNLVAAYEVPDYMMVIEATMTGPNKDAPSLITAVESGPISLSTFVNQSYNYIQFRTQWGGMDVGSIAIGATTGQTSNYWPYGAISGGSNKPFEGNTLDFSGLKEDPSGTFMTLSDPGGDGSTDTVFGTANGFFIVDSPNGSILGLQKAAAKDFDPSVAGTYNAIIYHKTNASMSGNNVESGTATLDKAVLTISATGGVTMTDDQGNALVPAGTTLTAVADTPYLYGSAGELADPCFGLFTARITSGKTQKDIFLTFINHAVVFSSFKATVPWQQRTGVYNYFYGVGVQ